MTFTVDVDFLDPDLGPVKSGDPMAERIEDAVAEAVKNARLCRRQRLWP